MSKPTTPVETYKAIIDQFANDTRLRGGGARIKRHGVYTKAPDDLHLNALVEALSSDQKELLCEMLDHERQAAMGDLLSDLDWWISCREVAMTFQGKSMPTDLEGGMHHDFTGRCMGYPWPSDSAS